MSAELIYPETALAIAILETGGFRARGMMRSHNWFGFRVNGSARQTGHKKGYGIYASPRAMLADYADFESRVIANHGLTDERAFRRWINRYYAEDPDYAKKLQTIIDSLNGI